MPNWHHLALAYQLERIRRGEITRLIINLPPRSLKSLMVTVAFPAFVLGHEPNKRIFAISYGDDLANKHSSDFRSVVESDWYQALVPRCGSHAALRMRCSLPRADLASQPR